MWVPGALLPAAMRKSARSSSCLGLPVLSALPPPLGATQAPACDLGLHTIEAIIGLILPVTHLLPDI